MLMAVPKKTWKRDCAPAKLLARLAETDSSSIEHMTGWRKVKTELGFRVSLIITL